MDRYFIKVKGERGKAKKIYKLEYNECYENAYRNYLAGINMTKFHTHDYIENNKFYTQKECIYYIINKLESDDFVNKVLLLKSNDILIIHNNTVVNDIKNSDYEKKKEKEINEFLKNKQAEATAYINMHENSEF